MEVALLSHQHQGTQAKTSIIPMTARQIGLKTINRKTKHLRMNNRSDAAITPGGEEINEVQHFTYLGQSSFFSIQSTWRAKNITTNTKIRLFKTNLLTLWCQSVEDDQEYEAQSGMFQDLMPQESPTHFLAQHYPKQRAAQEDRHQAH